MPATVHIIGAGLAGLSTAVQLAPSAAAIVVHEAGRQAGGRCRSFWDAATELTIDNGNHLLLSGNRAAQAYLRTIGSQSQLVGPDSARFAFADLATGERWTIRMNEGRIPWWIFDKRRRVPGTSVWDYLALGSLLRAHAGSTICDALACEGPLYERLLRPLLLAALNIEPREGDATLALAVVRETMLAGGRACHPLIARDGLTAAFIDPAMRYLEKHDVRVAFEHELRAITFDNGRATSLDFGSQALQLGERDLVVLAVPAYAAAALMPQLDPPTAFRSIANAHFRIAPPHGFPQLLGVVGGTAEWIFAFPDRVSVTISAADRLMNEPREALAQTIWDEVSRLSGLPAQLPPWQIVRERRATFAATPEQNAKRPGARTRWKNVILAGDWTTTGLPATIEGAIRSGHRAADCVRAANGGPS